MRGRRPTRSVSARTCPCRTSFLGSSPPGSNTGNRPYGTTGGIVAMQEEPAVHPSNAAQSAAWNGDEGAYWAEHADRFDDAVADYQRPLLDAAAITPTSRVLDIGCGAGRTALDAARIAVRGSVLGVDLSA